MVTKVSEVEEQPAVKEQELKRKIEQATAISSKESHHAPEKQAKKNDAEGDGHNNGISNGKEDLFDAHNFDIEIDVDTNVVAARDMNFGVKTAWAWRPWCCPFVRANEHVATCDTPRSLGAMSRASSVLRAAPALYWARK